MKNNAHRLVDSDYAYKLVSAIYGRGGLLSDEQIQELLIVNPCIQESPNGVISYGLTAYGYDMRIDRKFKVFVPGPYNVVVDPKDLDSRAFTDYEGDTCIIPPNSFALGVSVETFRIPRSVLGVCMGKSTYARCGIVVNVTPLEPEWRGRVTIEISNTTPLPARIYAGEGISQVIFIKGMRNCFTSYNDKKGRYQDQEDITLPSVGEPDEED
jgi:dCTP deaminase